MGDRLTTVAAVKEFKGGAVPPGMDALLDSLIRRGSDFLQQWLSVQFPTEAFTLKRLNGTGSNRLVLGTSPVLAMSYLSVDNGLTVIAESEDGIAPGFLIAEGSMLLLTATCFFRGYANIIASWEQGYVTAEAGIIPTGNTPTLTPATKGWAAEDRGVTLAGNAMTKVVGAPAAGQYAHNAQTGVYSFNTSNANGSVIMNYGYVPGAVEQACIDLVVTKLARRETMGIQSKSLANESVTFVDRDLTPGIKDMLMEYRRMIPL